MKIGHFWLLGDLLKRCNNVGSMGFLAGKPIALLFDENWPFLVAWRFGDEMQLLWKYGILG